MLNYLEAKDRERLLKKLEPRYKHAKLVLFGMPIEIDGRVFEPDFYLIVENADRESGRVFHLMITLNPFKPCKNTNALLMETRLAKFSNWWIKPKELEYLKRCFKPIADFLYYSY